MSTSIVAQPYSAWVSIRKGLAGLFSAFVSLLPLLGPAMIDVLLTGSTLTDALARTDPRLVIYAPFINAALRTIQNNRKQAKAQ